MLQCLNSHVRRLLNEKQQQEEELQKTKERFKQIFQGILHQFDQIERVFGSALKQRNWDHFSKPQRKNLELWNKQTQEIKQQQQEEFLSERVEDEMEMSDNDDNEVSSTKKRKTIEEQSYTYATMMAAQLDAEQLNTLKEDNDSLRCQLEAYKNEIDMVKQENTNNLESKEKEMKMLRQALQGMQQQLILAKQQASDIEKAREIEVKQLKEKVRQRSQSEGEKEAKEDKEGKETGDADKTDDTDETKEDDVTTETSTKDSPTKEIPGVDIPLVSSSTGITMTEKQAKLIGLISCFLHVHPTGASVDYIWSYLSQLGLHSRTSELEDLLDKLPMLFKRELSGVGASIERKWQFIGYKTTSPLSFLM
ncbi:hypothetical protein KUTeg_011772 [Tegillarca granosa]|uniref:Ecto-NOX disulfide-thiol exchanger 1/2 domain-containing protein n=1 Tax=Tegillarca granosa TaxID=220873 RepID=A0ABQ9EXL4_TEGGR|nr:hypothetical protein KUTeg_011772 [Tegillarca granosa]